MSSTRLPDVVYVGNMRSGSTYVRSFLDAHPQIVWSRKAWSFQLGDSDSQRCSVYARAVGTSDGPCKVDMYESLFLSQYFRVSPVEDWSEQDLPTWDYDWAAVPDYDLESGPMAIDPQEVARRVAACLPEGRVLIVLREQVSWMRSMYRHYLSTLPKHRRGFNDFLTTLEGLAAWEALRYDRVVESYLGVFGKERVHVRLLEEIAGDVSAAFRDLCHFLGVDSFEFDPEIGNRNEGISAEQARRLRYGRLKGAVARGGDILTEDEVRAVGNESIEGNRRLQELLDVDLGALGYVV